MVPKRPMDAALAAKNQKTAKWLLGGIFVLYNSYYALVTGMSASPAQTASTSFNYIAGNCLGVREPLPQRLDQEMWKPLKAASCLLTMAGSGGILVGSTFPDRNPSTSP